MPLDTARIAAILFDVDGTLSDTDNRWVQQVNRPLQIVRGFFPYHNTLPAARWLVMAVETPGNWVFELLDRMHWTTKPGSWPVDWRAASATKTVTTR